MFDLKPGLRSRTVIVASLLLVSLLTGGWLLEKGTRSGPLATREEGARLFDQVFARVSRNYVDSLGANSNQFSNTRKFSGRSAAAMVPTISAATRPRNRRRCERTIIPWS